MRHIEFFMSPLTTIRGLAHDRLVQPCSCGRQETARSTQPKKSGVRVSFTAELYAREDLKFKSVNENRRLDALFASRA